MKAGQAEKSCHRHYLRMIPDHVSTVNEEDFTHWIPAYLDYNVIEDLYEVGESIFSLLAYVGIALHEGMVLSVSEADGSLWFNKPYCPPLTKELEKEYVAPCH